MIESMPMDRDDGSWRNGHYRITEHGCKFVEGSISVAKYVYLYNQMVYGFSDGTKYPREYTTIHESLGDRFSYQELMAS